MSSHRDLVSRYGDLRKKSIRLCTTLAESLEPDAITTVARRFGIMKGKEILLDTEDELSVVMDPPIQDYRTAGENAAERYLRQHPPEEGTDERLLLEALTRPRYSLFECVNAERGDGHTRLLKPLPPEELSKMALLITGICIRSGAAESVRYAATDKLGPRPFDDLPNRPEPLHAPGKIGRNDPCPCGSGKKFRKCCGK